MLIKVYYKNGVQDIFDTKELTDSGAVSNPYKNVMTKFHIEWDEFLKDNKASHLNIYIYYYRNNNDQGTKITSEKYLDEMLFYDNDRKIYNNIGPEEVKRKGKALPYGSMEPGTWFTLVPYENKKNVLKIEIDDQTRLFRLHQTCELIDVFKLNMVSEQYLSVEENNLDLIHKINLLFNRIRNTYLTNDASIPINDIDIACEIGIPYSLIMHINNRIVKNSNKNRLSAFSCGI